MTRAAIVGIIGCVFFAIMLIAAGCQKGEVSPPSAADEAQQRALSELLKYAQETGQTLDDLRQTLARWRAAEQEKAAISPVRADVAVLSSLLSQATKAADNHDASACLAVLKRMSRVARNLLAQLPGQQVAVRVERALAAMAGEQPDVEQASAAILSALDVAINAREATLVPDVVNDLEAAKAAISSDASSARTSLLAVVEKCGRDKVAAWAYYIVEGLDNAFDAVQREAWPVVSAELEQVNNLIGRIRGAITGQGGEEEKPAAAEAPARPEAGAPSESASPAPETSQPSKPATQPAPGATGEGQPTKPAAGAAGQEGQPPPTTPGQPSAGQRTQ